MNLDSSALGGRLPLLDPARLSSNQKKTYDTIFSTMVPWAKKSGFQSTAGDKLIGPFNSMLLSPEISERFLDLISTEKEKTRLTPRLREIVILSVGSVWKSEYELYAHSAVAAGLKFSAAAVQALTAGAVSEELSPEEKIAQQFTLRLSADHFVDDEIYGAAERAFGQDRLSDLIYLAGLYHTTCLFLNAFRVPAPLG